MKAVITDVGGVWLYEGKVGFNVGAKVESERVSVFIGAGDNLRSKLRAQLEKEKLVRSAQGAAVEAADEIRKLLGTEIEL